ncbi:S41 family peptidase [candidate division KSB1 bacterium]
MKSAMISLLLIVGFSAGLSAADDQLIGARFPAISPDGSTIVFSYMGDIWTVSSSGGAARRLTNHIAYDREPIWSPDGMWIAFSSNRMGNNDIYVISSAGGEPRQITFHTGSDVATDFSPDGDWIYFTSGRYSSSSIFRIPFDGGNAIPVLDTYWSWPHDGKVSPDARGVLFSLGMENNSKWRHGYRGANSAKIWFRDFNRNEAELLVADESNSFWPCWNPEGNRIFFVSEREYGTSNIWSAARDGSDIRAVTRYRESDIRWMKAARNVPLAAYERDFGIWITDLISGESHAVRIDSPTETKENHMFFVENGNVSEFKVSPDGKKIAAVVRGEIFVMSTEGGYARNITGTPLRERDIGWDNDSRNIVYVSDENANPNLYIVSALGGESPSRLTDSDADIRSPVFSPDGALIAYYSGTRQLRLVQPDGRNDRLLVEEDLGGRVAAPFSWSPDGKYIAIVGGAYADENIFAVNVETGEKTALTNTAYDESNPAWSPDGTSLFFSSNRYGHSFPEFTGKWDIYRLFLEPQEPVFDEDEFEKLFSEDDKSGDEEDKESVSEVEVELNLDNIDTQTEQVANTLGSERQPLISAEDPQTVYFVSNMTGTSSLWKTTYENGRWSRYEPFMPQVTSPGNLQFDDSGKYLYYSSGGRIGRIDVKAGRNENISFDTKIEVDKTADYEQMLAETYYVLQHYFYDDNLHNLDWKKTYGQFLPVLKQVREDQDFYDYANEMIGRLNSSHTGIRGPGGAVRTEKPSAHLGALWNFSGSSVTIEKILKDGPLYRYRDRISEGDEVVSINGTQVDPGENIWKILNGTMDRRVRLTVRSRASGEEITVDLKPISNGDERNLIKEEWVESRREIVADKTGDNAAYIHMAAMGQGDLTRFLKELERDAVPRQGLILDLRNNFGGNVHDRVLEALTKPVYAKWQVRGLSETPQSTYGFANKPVVIITNEVTLSDGEMTANGFKALNRGTIVGNTTYGWLIFTSSWRLLNGGSFRLPFWGCYTLDGQNIETMGGIKPDITVINDLNHDLTGQDPQLDRAVEEIMKMIR